MKTGWSGMNKVRFTSSALGALCLLALSGATPAQTPVQAPKQPSAQADAKKPAAQQPAGEPGEIYDPTFVNDAFTGEQIHFESVQRGEPGGDKLAEARQVAAAIVAQDRPNPHMIVDVGSHAGEFLEAFLQQFPNAKGQWTEPVEDNHANAIRRFARLPNKVSYVIGCPNRDLSLGCVPKDVDVLITAWLTIHQDFKGIQKFYKEAAAMLPSGGWIANLDHVAYGGAAWEKRMKGARTELKKVDVMALSEGPKVHHLDYVTPTLDDQIGAMKAAGFSDVQAVWRRLDTVLIMGRKP